jgi:hypothetical protein
MRATTTRWHWTQATVQLPSPRGGGTTCQLQCRRKGWHAPSCSASYQLDLCVQTALHRQGTALIR